MQYYENSAENIYIAGGDKLFSNLDTSALLDLENGKYRAYLRISLRNLKLDLP